MFRYILRRSLTYLVMVFLTTTMGYFAAVTTLKPALLEQEKVPRPSPEQVNRTLASLGLDPEMSAWDRYIQWLTNVVTKFDWGRSPNSGYINQEFGQRLWVSTRLMLAATILTIIIGVALGVYSAARQYKFSDRVITGYSYLVYIIPAPVAYFVVQQGATAINNIVVENGGEKIFYVTGISTPGVTGFWDTTIDMAAHYVVPTFCMTIFGWASYQIAQRQYLLDNVNADFVRTARAKGLTRNQAITRHALRVSFIPVAQSIAYTIPTIFAGAFFAESVFAWPGIGKRSIDAIGQQDVNAATATLAYGSVLFAIGAIIADIATTIVDPRVRIS